MKSCLPVLLLFVCSHAAFGNERPNILYVLADDLGFSDLGCFGGEIETPVLDSLAAGGIRLTQFYNTGRCCPSRASLLTGQYPHRVGLGHMTTNDLGRPGYRGVVSSDAKTIAETLAPAGYQCFMSGKWHLGTPDPTQHGFEEFYGTLVSAKRFFDPTHLIRLPQGRKARQYPEGTFLCDRCRYRPRDRLPRLSETKSGAAMVSLSRIQRSPLPSSCAAAGNFKVCRSLPLWLGRTSSGTLESNERTRHRSPEH